MISCSISIGGTDSAPPHQHNRRSAPERAPTKVGVAKGRRPIAIEKGAGLPSASDPLAELQVQTMGFWVAGEIPEEKVEKDEEY
uniref:Uncharacterized protein n=1 Tax=Heterorhabditis bacteriophora TaxID=37862 RepID=A0A1I7WSQ6_HETBA